MSVRPEIKPGDWITVEHWQSVVCRVHEEGGALGDAEVVCKPAKPANFSVRWNGSAWVRLYPDDLGGYAESYERLRPFVDQLKAGK